jgi:predicted O-linked N-acetylglucosamine transferase (SPINDLY family)
MSDDIFQSASRKARARDLSLAALVTVAAELTAAGQTAQARELYDIWASANSDDPQLYVALFNNAVLATETGDPVRAEESLRRAIELNPDFLPAHINLGGLLERAGAADRAVAQWRDAAARALPVNGHSVRYVTAALKQIARVMSDRQQSESAELALRLSLEIDPSQGDALEQFIALRLAQCRWPIAEPLERLNRTSMVRGIHPLSMAAYTDDPLLQLAASDHFSRAQAYDHPGDHPDNSSCDRRHAPIDVENRRLRVGYVSSDLRDHAVGYLMAELFELHDRSRIEIFAYYCGPESTSALHERISKAVEHWTPIRGMSDDEAAMRIAADGIDILVDVNGHTRDSRTGVFARRPAPIQVNWLGYPGTMGTPYHHYIIADEAIIPPEAELYYSEKVLRLPCYQPNDRRRVVAARTPTRAEAGLPDGSFVYCCFNGTHKTTRFTFLRWLEILRRGPNGVLWLLDGPAETQQRLRDFAEANGVAAERIIFAPKLANPEHLARYRLADVFLDTTPYGAHTTASDALWMGVPVLTVPGRCFASRVCASLVRAAGLPDLVCAGASDLVERAVELAGNPARLAILKRRLLLGRDDCVLFNTELLVRNLEDLYRRIAADHARGFLPRPDLTNLDDYLEVGLALDHDAQETGAIADYHDVYKSGLARRHRRRPLHPDQRLWMQADIAAVDTHPPTQQNSRAPANDAESDIDARFARIFAQPNGNHPLLQLRDMHDLASAILCRRLDVKSAQQLDHILTAARNLVVPVPAGSELEIWEKHHRRLDVTSAQQLDQVLTAARKLVVPVPAGSELEIWEKHYRLLTNSVDLRMVLDPAPEPAPEPDVSFASTTGVPMGRTVVQAHAARLGARVVFFTAADESYVAQYARWHLLSILKYCDVPFLVVSHVIGRADNLCRIAASVGIEDERIIFAGDHFDAAAVTTQCYDAPPKGRSERPIAHFQCNRFLQAGNLLETLDLPMFVSDIDLLLQRGVADLLEQHANADVVLNENTISAAAGSRLTANLLLMNPTANARYFLRFLRAYLEQALARPEVTRWIDQLGLILARHHLTIHRPDARIGYFDTNSDINNVIYPSYRQHPFRFLSLYHGFDTSSLENNPDVLGGNGAGLRRVAGAVS